MRLTTAVAILGTVSINKQSRVIVITTKDKHEKQIQGVLFDIQKRKNYTTQSLSQEVVTNFPLK